MKIGVIHATVNAVSPLMEAFGKAAPDVRVLNFVNENLLAMANEKGMVDDIALRAFARTAFEAADAGVDGIIVACSVYCKFVPLIQNFISVPVIAIDRPMIERALNCGNKIGVVATTALAAPAARKQLEQGALEMGKTIIVEEAVVTEAMTALRKGNLELHNKIIADACRNLDGKGCDCIILCQITMACAADAVDGINARILTSPEEGVRKMLELQKRIS